MKRSTAVTLVILGAAGLTAYALSRSDGETEAAAFNSVDECKTAGLEGSTCETSLGEALKAHETDAPRFEAQADCEKDYGVGKCTPKEAQSSTGSMSSYFVPALVGFAVARALGSQTQTGQPAVQPLYNCPPERQAAGGNCYNTSSGRSFYTGSGGSSSGSSSSSNFYRSRTASVPSETFSRASPGSNVVARGGSVSSVSRGGFGASGRSFSSSSS